MNPTIIKGTIGVLSASGLGVGGYYGISALTKQKEPRTISEQLIADNYQPFDLNKTDWQNKFDTFRAGSSTTKLKAALQEFVSGFEVEKNKANLQGGTKLKDWCKLVLEQEKDKVTGHKTLDNAKLFCAEKKAIDS
ncbi:hypothetical protein A6V39_03685 [Candidatus Mycoplasma haematobovis]|uniref:Uncharacterized protein n=1 Tax=Candidatus Mycoplasma haematobovis TaxID=432608 RepID=A0A1A9QCM0_9MOLU|nr:hypothetical protein [Candidatus Mycoplasma haematobovis]OAL09988.1 hypothetical protein A6V39_03685 [Candidatus Mycoplasma haematobovis]